MPSKRMPLITYSAPTLTMLEVTALDPTSYKGMYGIWTAATQIASLMAKDGPSSVPFLDGQTTLLVSPCTLLCIPTRAH